jgi:SAM-dependent methyltransferase
MAVPEDAWRSGSAYDAYMGRWSAAVAATVVPRLGVPPGLSWIDVGCGTGVVSAAVLRWGEPGRLLGIDASRPFVEAARKRIVDPRADFVVGDALALPVDEGTADVVVSGLVLNFLPDPGEALALWRRALRAGGVLACYVWDYAHGMEMLANFWAAATTLDPRAETLDEGRRFSVSEPGRLREVGAAAGLADVTVEPVEVPMVFSGFDDYWLPFLAGTGPAPSYAASLSEQARGQLREALRDRLAAAPDGAIAMRARAFVLRGGRSA